MLEQTTECVTADSFANIDEAWAHYEVIMLEGERKRAFESGIPFNPNAPDVRERVDSAVCEALDELGLLEPDASNPNATNA